MNFVGIILGVVALLGFFAWVIVAISVVRILVLAPKGERMRVYGKLGWWNMSDVRAIVGPASEPHVNAMKRAGATFIICAVAAIGLGALLAATSQS